MRNIDRHMKKAAKRRLEQMRPLLQQFDEEVMSPLVEYIRAHDSGDTEIANAQLNYLRELFADRLEEPKPSDPDAEFLLTK